VKPTTILLVTFECVGKIQWFLADVNCIQQEVQDHPNGIIHRVEVRAVGWPHVWLDQGDILTPQVRDCVPSRVTLLHSCAEVRAAIELSFWDGEWGHPRHSCVRWGSTCLKWKGWIWGSFAPIGPMISMSCWSYVAPSSLSSVFYDKICLKCALHHFLLYAVYICQKSLNFTYTFKCYQQNCSWLHFTWTTLYIILCIICTTS